MILLLAGWGRVEMAGRAGWSPLLCPVGSWDGWMGQAGTGGLFAAVAICSHAFCQGHAVGRCRVSCRAERAIRPGTVMSWARIVPVVALAWKADASVPATRVRLNAIVAQTAQAEFAQKCPSVILRRLVDHGFDLGFCVVDGLVDAGWRRLWSARSDEFRPVPVGRVAALGRAEDQGSAPFAEGLGERVA